jgi:hypothetical protein
MIVKAVIKLQMDQWALATVPTKFGDQMEINDSVSRKLQYCKQLHEQKNTVTDYHPGNHSLTYVYHLHHLTQFPLGPR